MNLEVETRSDLDLCDGCEWENFLVNNLSRLKIFNFKFQLKSTIILNISGIQNVLKSFSSYFWLVEKQWFVAIEWGQRLIYSVPRFSCESADPNFRPPIHCTTLNCKIFYDHINALAVWGQTNRRFTNVKELWLVDNPLTMNIEAMVDVNRIERLICVSSKADLSIDTLINLISKMKNLAYIQFFDIPLSFVAKNKPSPIMRQIRSVELMREYKSFSSIQTLNRIFPQIERLHMKIKSNDDIQKILNCFSSNLSIVKFDCDASKISIGVKTIEKILGHSNFTLAISLISIRLWIGTGKVMLYFFSFVGYLIYRQLLYFSYQIQLNVQKENL